MLNNQNQDMLNNGMKFLENNVIENKDLIDDSLTNQLHTKSTISHKVLTRRITKLKVEIPALLAESFGYEGNARWIQIFWASEQINKPICSDGKTFYFSNKLCWEIFLENIVCDVEQLNISSDTHSFLLDRWENNLYVGTKQVVSELLTNQDCLGLLCTSNKKSNILKLSNYASVFTIAAILGATIAGVLFSIGLGIYQAAH